MFLKNAKYLGDMKDHYMPFMKLILKALVVMKSDIQREKHLDSNEIDLMNIKERITYVDSEFKDKNSELFIRKVESPKKSQKAAYILILFVRDPSLQDENNGGDLFMGPFNKIINGIKNNIFKVCVFNLESINNLNLSEKDFSVNYVKLPKKKSKGKKKKNNDQDENMDRIENNWIANNRKMKVIGTEKDLQDVIYPYSHLYLYEENIDASKFPEILTPNMLDLEFFKILFSQNTCLGILNKFGYEIGEEDLEYNLDNGFNLDKKIYYDLRLDEFTLENFISSKFPLDNSKKDILIQGLLLHKNDSIIEENSVNKFDQLLTDILKMSNDKLKKGEEFGDIFLMGKRFFSSRFKEVQLFNNTKNKRDYDTKYARPLTRLKKEIIEYMDILLDDVIEEIDNYYSKSTISIINWANKERKDSEGITRFFQYPTSKRDDYNCFNLFLFDKKFSVFTNYFLYISICMDNVAYMASNKEKFFLFLNSFHNMFEAKFCQHFNVYMSGNSMVGKSWFVDTLKAFYIQGTVTVGQESSLRSKESETNECYGVNCVNEASRKTMQDGKFNKDSMDHEYKKDILTQQMINRQTKQKQPNGTMKTVNITKAVICCEFNTSNDLLKKDSPMGSRYYNTQQIPPKDPTKIDKMISASDLQKTTNPDDIELLKNMTKDMQYLSAITHFNNNVGVLKDPTLVMSKYVVNYIFSEMKKKGIYLNSAVRGLNNFYISLSEMTITDAILKVFCVPGGPYYGKKYDSDAIFEIEKRSYSSFSTTIMTLCLYYDQIFEASDEKKFIDDVFSLIFNYRKAIIRFERSTMKINKEPLKYQYVYKNQDYVEEKYEDKGVDKIKINHSFVDLDSVFEKHQINLTYHLFALSKLFVDDKNILTTGFKQVIKGEKKYYDLNYNTITVRDLNEFARILSKHGTKKSENDVKNLIEYFQKKKIQPELIMKYVDQTKFQNERDKFIEFVHSDGMKIKINGKSREEADDAIRGSEYFKKNNIIQFINLESENTEKRRFSEDSGLYDGTGLPCCIYEESQQLRKETNKPECVYISFLVQFRKFDILKCFTDTIKSMGYEGFVERKILLPLSKEDNENYNVIEMKGCKDKTIEFENASFIEGFRENIIKDCNGLSMSTNKLEKRLIESLNKNNIIEDEEYTFTDIFKSELKKKTIKFGKGGFGFDIDNMNCMLHQEAIGTENSKITSTDKRLNYSEISTFYEYEKFMNNKWSEGDKIQKRVSEKMKEYHKKSYPNDYSDRRYVEDLDDYLENFEEDTSNSKSMMNDSNHSKSKVINEDSNTQDDFPSLTKRKVIEEEVNFTTAMKRGALTQLNKENTKRTKFN